MKDTSTEIPVEHRGGRFAMGYGGKRREGGEIAVLPWNDGLAMISLPTDDPMDALEPLKPTGEDRFRRVRKDDGELAEEVVFQVVNGEVTRFTQHNNYLPRVR